MLISSEVGNRNFQYSGHWLLPSILVFALIYSPFVGSLFGIGNLKEIALLFFLAFAGLSFLKKPQRFVDRTLFIYAVFSFILLFVSYLFWYSLSTPGSYVSIFIVFLIFLFNSQFQFERLIKLTLIISVFIAFWEFFTQKYLYVVTTTVNGETFYLDEKLFSGNLNIFRAKGLFEGPLTFAQFCVFSSLLFFNNKKILVIAFVGAMLTASRMAIFVIFATILVSFYSAVFNDQQRRALLWEKVFTIVALLLMLSGILIYIYNANSDFASRLAETFDFSSSDSNRLRLYFWTMALVTYSNFSIEHIFFGNNGLFRSIFSNNAESGWLTLLVDNGLVGTLLYLVPCLYVFSQGLLRKKYEYLFGAFVYLLVNSTMTFYLSASGNVLYWYIIFTWIRMIRYEKRSKSQVSPIKN